MRLKTLEETDIVVSQVLEPLIAVQDNAMDHDLTNTKIGISTGDCEAQCIFVAEIFRELV